MACVSHKLYPIYLTLKAHINILVYLIVILIYKKGGDIPVLANYCAVVVIMSGHSGPLRNNNITAEWSWYFFGAFFVPFIIRLRLITLYINLQTNWCCKHHKFICFPC